MKAPLALFNGSYLSHRPTGIGVVARDLITALDPELVPLLDPLGGERPFSVSIPSTLSPEHGRKGHLARLLWTQNQLPGLMKASGASVLLSPLPEAPLGRGVRSVVLAHDLLPLRYPQLSPLLAYHLAYVPLVLHRAVRVLCNSEATAREVHGRLGVPLRRLVPLRLGFDPGRLRPLHLEREPFFLVLGRHDPHKNLMGVLRAFAAVPDPNGELRLKLVGPHDGRYTPRLQRLAQELGIDARCDWLPWVSDGERLSLLNRCRALVMVSFWEGFGLPALEAMACETPVIAARAGALPEVVGDTALLVNPSSPPEIAAAMAQLARHTGLARALGTAGAERARRFRWDQTAADVLTVLRDVA
ncbi:MAG: glycosyltransferase family 1 protein [Cyanobacteriota bacterium]|nr:glycosyltransferase family 1 protein [Cyanobacteriota bacterium]